MVLLSKIDDLLKPALKDYQSGLSKNYDGTRILGFVVSPDFDALDHAERQRKLWAILEGGLSKIELASIGPIITMTPADADIGENAA